MSGEVKTEDIEMENGVVIIGTEIFQEAGSLGAPEAYKAAVAIAIQQRPVS
jgi:cytoskeletal protein CcmA (bactofilin family)